MTREKGVGRRIKQIRKALNIKQKDFAEKLNISGPSLSEIETGKYKPGFDFLEKITKEFNANLYYIILDEGEMFLEPNGTYIKSASNFGANNEDVHKFLWYFERSSILHYYLLSAFKTKLLKDKEIIEKEIEEYEMNKEES